jgi:hypothetical protein
MADPTIIQAYDNNNNALPDTKKNLESSKSQNPEVKRCGHRLESSRTTITIYYFWSDITLHSQMAHGRRSSSKEQRAVLSRAG